MGIATQIYLEALISHKMGFPVKLKNWKDNYKLLARAKEEIGKLVGSELAEFNRVHIRDAEGKFADKVGTAVAHKVEEVSSKLPKRPGGKGSGEEARRLKALEEERAKFGHVSHDPESIEEVEKILKKNPDFNIKHERIARFVYNPKNDKLYFFDAHKGIHAQFSQKYLNIRNVEDYWELLNGMADFDRKEWQLYRVSDDEFLKNKDIIDKIKKLFKKWKLGQNIEEEFYSSTKGLNILEDIFVTKSLTGAALEAFNKLHPRGAEGTRIGGRFVKKVEGIVGEAIESAMTKVVKRRPGASKPNQAMSALELLKNEAKLAYKRGDTIALQETKKKIEDQIHIATHRPVLASYDEAWLKRWQKEISDLGKLFKSVREDFNNLTLHYDKILSSAHNSLKSLFEKGTVVFQNSSDIKPHHIADIKLYMKEVYERTGLRKLNSIDIIATDIKKSELYNESSAINTGARALKVAPTFPFENLKGKVRYWQKYIDREKAIIKELRHHIETKYDPEKHRPWRFREEQLKFKLAKSENKIKEYREIQRKLTKGEFIDDHSAFNIDPPYRAMVYHELGHQWHHDNLVEVNRAFEKHNFIKYGATRRGEDNWNECIAENFTLYMADLKQHMHSDMVKFFDLHIAPPKGIK
jgi:hypothetical protein